MAGGNAPTIDCEYTERARCALYAFVHRTEEREKEKYGGEEEEEERSRERETRSGDAACFSYMYVASGVREGVNKTLSAFSSLLFVSLSLSLYFSICLSLSVSLLRRRMHPGTKANPACTSLVVRGARGRRISRSIDNRRREEISAGSRLRAQVGYLSRATTFTAIRRDARKDPSSFPPAPAPARAREKSCCCCCDSSEEKATAWARTKIAAGELRDALLLFLLLAFLHDFLARYKKEAENKVCIHSVLKERSSRLIQGR